MQNSVSLTQSLSLFNAAKTLDNVETVQSPTGLTPFPHYDYLAADGAAAFKQKQNGYLPIKEAFEM